MSRSLSCLLSLLFMSNFFLITSQSMSFSASDGAYKKVQLPQPFVYDGVGYNETYINRKGYLTFDPPSNDGNNPSPSQYHNVIALFWADFGVGVINYDIMTTGLDFFSQMVSSAFPRFNFTPSYMLVVSWNQVPLVNSGEVATFRAHLLSGGNLSFTIMRYTSIPVIPSESWMAGFRMEGQEYKVPAENTADLQLSNINTPSFWVFKVHEKPTACDSLNCTLEETCELKNGVYGCACASNMSLPNPFDATTTCNGSTGSLSLSRCQLFSAGYAPENLHLNDPNCTGTFENDRLVFKFNNEHMCGTILQSNSTHFIYENTVGSVSMPVDFISRSGGLNISFSCVYPLIQNISMPMSIVATGSVVSRELSTEGSYTIHMVPYSDSGFQSSLAGNVTLQVNQSLYIEVKVDRFDNQQIVTVLDSCWATPVDDIYYNIRWDLITNECPNPNDNTVTILQNGVSTSGQFSFHMFTFTGYSSKIFLHCQVHLCLKNGNNCAPICNIQSVAGRRHRSADIHDSASISMGF